MKKSTFWDGIVGLFCFLVIPCVDWYAVFERVFSIIF